IFLQHKRGEKVSPLPFCAYTHRWWFANGIFRLYDNILYRNQLAHGVWLLAAYRRCDPAYSDETPCRTVSDGLAAGYLHSAAVWYCGLFIFWRIAPGQTPGRTRQGHVALYRTLAERIKREPADLRYGVQRGCQTSVSTVRSPSGH